MPSKSAGILLYRRRDGQLQVLLVHPGGPFWAKRDLGAWTIPKGEFGPDEDPEAAARREFAEELGVMPAAPLTQLGEVRQKAGKIVLAFAMEGEFNTTMIRSNTFEMEWPPRSGSMRSFPEIDRAEWFGLKAARDKINPGQLPFLDRLEQLDADSQRSD
jgi:predicted NUDIX family NTP pyrophosphohydrolase